MVCQVRCCPGLGNQCEIIHTLANLHTQLVSKHDPAEVCPGALPQRGFSKQIVIHRE